MKFFRKLKLFLRLRRDRSMVATGLVPLSALSSAVLYLDTADVLPEHIKTSIDKFFGQKGIKLSFLCADDPDLRTIQDLFISLSTSGDIFERYAAVCSEARFKVGRRQLKGDIYDFVVTDNGPEPIPAAEAFSFIESFINNIQ